MAEFTEDQRKKLAENEQAMPDGSYPIRNRQDLKNAIQAYGRSKNKQKTKAWIKKRARELKAEDLLPDEWTEEIWHYDIDGDPANNTEGSSTKKKFTFTENQKKWIKRGVIVVDSILAAYGGYKLSQTDPVKKLANDVASKIDNELYQKKSK